MLSVSWFPVATKRCATCQEFLRTQDKKVVDYQEFIDVSLNNHSFFQLISLAFTNQLLHKGE